MNSYDIFKSLHIIFVVTWFAGLFYIVRLFVYHREAQERSIEDPIKYQSESKVLINQYKIMERRLWLGITWPSALVTLLFGLHLSKEFWPFTDNPWIIVKLVFVALLYAYHFYCGKLFKLIQAEEYSKSSNVLRLINEIPTVLLFAIVFLVVLKSTVAVWYGFGALLALILVLLLAIRVYRIKRENSPS